MKEPSTIYPVVPVVPDDHIQVLALLNSAEMQQRLHNARVQRAKILKTRNSQLADVSVVYKGGGGSAVKSSINASNDIEYGRTIPEVTVQRQPIKTKTAKQSRTKFFTICLVPGLALGLGLTWYSLLGNAVAPAALQGASTSAAQNRLETAGGYESVKETTQNYVVVDTAPKVQINPENPILVDLLPGRPLDDKGPVLHTFGISPEAPEIDRVTLNTASTVTPPKANQPRPQLPPILSLEKVPIIGRDTPIVGQKRPLQVLIAEPVADQPPFMPIDLVNLQPLEGQFDRLSSSAKDLERVTLQVRLYFSPSLSQEERENAKILVTTNEAEVSSARISKFSILQSEIRFFHKADAVFATTMARDMRILARDYSTYRPTPAEGTLEIWLANES